MRKIPDIAFPSQTSSFLSFSFSIKKVQILCFLLAHYALCAAMYDAIFSPIHLMYYHHNFISHKIIIQERQDVFSSALLRNEHIEPRRQSKMRMLELLCFNNSNSSVFNVPFFSPPPSSSFPHCTSLSFFLSSHSNEKRHNVSFA